ncbi:hypothetical protein MOO44_01220 (plasmid) [Nicoliella spurrieriana]|uniref:Uncharacterized protein n=1 Tax=Nicoliella spurrieriana TaxID=2925830 RepID=A0A976RQG6_9LACO|nr:pectate lyase-like adhesive domain-containing protein [Nicoliella spurrieriana]UQS85970.1 hypothetical protein MOO44_01220 [Nicoliella spurrieriana]
MFNQKTNEKKNLRKVKKRWIIFSTAIVLATAFGGVISDNYMAHASEITQMTTNVKESYELINAMADKQVQQIDLGTDINMTGINLSELPIDQSRVSSRNNMINIPGRDLSIDLNGHVLNLGSVQFNMELQNQPASLEVKNGQLTGNSPENGFNFDSSSNDSDSKLIVTLTNIKKTTETNSKNNQNQEEINPEKQLTYEETKSLAGRPTNEASSTDLESEVDDQGKAANSSEQLNETSPNSDTVNENNKLTPEKSNAESNEPTSLAAQPESSGVVEESSNSSSKASASSESNSASKTNSNVASSVVQPASSTSAKESSNSSSASSSSSKSTNSSASNSSIASSKAPLSSAVTDHSTSSSRSTKKTSYVKANSKPTASSSEASYNVITTLSDSVASQGDSAPVRSVANSSVANQNHESNVNTSLHPDSNQASNQSPSSKKQRVIAKKANYLKLKQSKSVKLYKQKTLKGSSLNRSVKLKSNQKYRILKQFKNKNGKMVYKIKQGYLVTPAANLKLLK